MSSLIENQNKILALEAEIVELKQKLTGFEAELKAEGKSASEILVLLSEDKQLLTEMTRRLAGLEAERRIYLEQQTSAGRNIVFHSNLFHLFPTIFNLFPFHLI